MTMTTIILAVLALYVVQLFLQETSRYRFDMWAIMGARDNPPEMSVVAARLERARNNMLEALPMFLAVALLAIIKDGDASAATRPALLFLIARAAYVPAYVSGAPVLRSLIWLAGMGGLAWMAVAVV